MRIVPLLIVIPFRSAIPPMSTKADGLAKRSLSRGRMLWPPAISLESSWEPSNSMASATEPAL